ncbi:hypothetical protein Tco_0517581 [Tanacetum coccineum]
MEKEREVKKEEREVGKREVGRKGGRGREEEGARRKGGEKEEERRERGREICGVKIEEREREVVKGIGEKILTLLMCHKDTFSSDTSIDFQINFSSSVEGIFLEHKVSSARIDVDRAKIDSIAKLSQPTNVRAIRSFLGHAGFYRRFIKDFSQVARPLTQLMVKDAPFIFSEECVQAFKKLKHELTQAPFDIEIRDKKGAENRAADHLSRLKNPELEKLTKAEIRDMFPKEKLMSISDQSNEPWYADYANYLASRVLSVRTSRQEIQNSLVISGTTFGMNHTNSNNVPIRSSGEVSQERRYPKSFDNVTVARLVDTTGLPRSHEKFKRLVFTGLIFFATQENWYKNVMHVKGRVTSPPEMKCPRNTSKSVKYSTFGVSISWDHSLLLTETNELRLEAYESSVSYKERTKRWHDKRINPTTKYEKADKVLLFNSRLRLFPGKLKSRWYGPFTVSRTMKSVAIELCEKEENEFIVNRQRVKLYNNDSKNFDSDDDIILENQGGVT